MKIMDDLYTIWMPVQKPSDTKWRRHQLSSARTPKAEAETKPFAIETNNIRTKKI